jgi:hypothetical protein
MVAPDQSGHNPIAADSYDPVTDEWFEEYRTRAQRQAYIAAGIRRAELERSWKPIDYQGSLANQLENVDTEPVYVVKELMPLESVCQISAQYKAGKTTFMTNLVESLATGQPFLNRFAVNGNFKGNIAHWNLEVSQRTLLGWYARQSIPADALHRCYPLSVRGNVSLDFRSDVAIDWTIKWLTNNNIRAWIIDPLSKLYRDDENSNSEFTRWWMTLEHIIAESKLKLTVIAHHTGHSGQRARGASAMMGNPDVLLNYTHRGELGGTPPDNIRFLEGIGRDVDLSAIEIDFDSEHHRLFATKSGRTREASKSERLKLEAARKIWELDRDINTGDFYKAIGWTQQGANAVDFSSAIKAAISDGYMVQRKEGRFKVISKGARSPFDALKGGDTGHD